MSKLVTALATCVLFSSSAVARAETPEEQFRAAVAAEARLDFPAALLAYRQAFAAAPSASFAARARVRAEDLADHAEGNFVPLARLEAVRRDPGRASDANELQSLLQEARVFPPGRTRTEALLLVAEGFGRRLGRPADALAPAEAILDDPGVDRTTRSHALSIVVDSYTALGNPAHARAAAVAHRALAPSLARRFEVEERRRALTLAAEGLLAAIGLLGVAAAVHLARLRGSAALVTTLWAPASFAVVTALTAGGAGLAHLYDPSMTMRPFVLLGAFVLSVDRAIALTAKVGCSRAARASAAALGVAGVLSAAFLALVLSDPAFIASFGL